MIQISRYNQKNLNYSILFNNIFKNLTFSYTFILLKNLTNKIFYNEFFSKFLLIFCQKKINWPFIFQLNIVKHWAIQLFIISKKNLTNYISNYTGKFHQWNQDQKPISPPSFYRAGLQSYILSGVPIYQGKVLILLIKSFIASE